MKPKFLAVVLAAAFLAACSVPPATPTPEVPPPLHPYAPLPGDSDLVREPVYLDSTDLLVLESYPPQFVLQLTGNLPTPCDELRLTVGEPQEDNRILVEAYALVDPAETCIAVLEPFEASLPLGSFPSGHYTLWVNGEQVAEFDA